MNYVPYGVPSPMIQPNAFVWSDESLESVEAGASSRRPGLRPGGKGLWAGGAACSRQRYFQSCQLAAGSWQQAGSLLISEEQSNHRTLLIYFVLSYPRTFVHSYACPKVAEQPNVEYRIMNVE